MTHPPQPTRRRILQVAASAPLLAHGVGCARRLQPTPAPAVRRARPPAPLAVQSGDPGADRAILWACADAPGRMVVDWATNPEFRGARTLRGPELGAARGFTAQIDVPGLPPGQRIHYRVRLASLDGKNTLGPARTGSLQTSLPTTPAASSANVNSRSVRIQWGADVAGQGWGIDPSRGGMGIFQTMQGRRPDLFVHCGDTIYADGPIEPQRHLPDGSMWENIVTPSVAKVAETLTEFRDRYRYNLLDDNLRHFIANTATVACWDDHETVNNWYPGEVLDAPQFANERSLDVLAARAKQAFFEHMPVRPHGDETGRIYRQIPVGPGVEVFVLDMRSYRGPNSRNLQATASGATALLGNQQVNWLINAVRSSRATWKIIASDMPIGLWVRDGNNSEAVANGDDGGPKGRELELAHILGAWRDASVRNVAWVTGDVHYPAAHHYHPDRAAPATLAALGGQGFEPFWEFVAGPLHAGAFGPAPLDGTFGPEVVFQKPPPRQALGPPSGHQYFGELEVQHGSGALTVRLINAAGDAVFERQLRPQ